MWNKPQSNKQNPRSQEKINERKRKKLHAQN
jgi:hypothetical protein